MATKTLPIIADAGENFRQVRKDLCLSQEEMSVVCGIAQSMVCMIEKGNRDIPLIALKQLYEIFNINPLFIITGTRPMRIKKTVRIKTEE